MKINFCASRISTKTQPLILIFCLAVSFFSLGEIAGSAVFAQSSADQSSTGQSNVGVEKEKRDPSVGAAGFISQIILPGSELKAKPLVEGTPVVIRITKTFPHGDRFRYDMRFHGLEPGKFNLADWLERKDGSTTDDLPAIDVEIQSLLPAGQIQPNELESGWLPRLGGYRIVATGIALIWMLGLLALIFMGRKKKQAEQEAEKKLTLADLLKSRIQAVNENRVSTSQYAELERMLFGYWRKRLKLEDVSTEQALVQIKQNKEAGPLINQLEQWMHNPSADKNVDLASLLEPYRELSADTPGFES